MYVLCILWYWVFTSTLTLLYSSNFSFMILYPVAPEFHQSCAMTILFPFAFIFYHYSLTSSFEQWGCNILYQHNIPISSSSSIYKYHRITSAFALLGTHSNYCLFSSHHLTDLLKELSPERRNFEKIRNYPHTNYIILKTKPYIFAPCWTFNKTQCKRTAITN